MKKTAIFLFCFSFVTAAMGKLYYPPQEWYLDAPGGTYGVFSCHTEWSKVLIGPISFTSNFGFENTKLIYFEIIPILIAGLILGMFLHFLKRRMAADAKPGAEKKCDGGLHWYYLLLALLMIGGIAVCTWLPDVKAWRQQVINEKLCLAILDDDFENVKKYISTKNINREFMISRKDKNYGYPPPLLLAASNGNFTLVKFLLSSGADINQKTNSDRASVLHFVISAKKDREIIIKYLLQHGIDIDAVNLWQRSSLFSAVEYNAGIEIVKLLLESGAKVNLVDNGGRSTLDVAKNDDVRKLLLQYGAKSGKELSTIAVSSSKE